MLTNKNSARNAINSVRGVLAACLVLFLLGCQPPGPKSLLLGQKYLEQRDYAKALKYLTRASELMKEHPQVWNHLGLAYHGLQQPGNAVDAYQRAVRIDRNLPAPHYNLGVLLLEQQHLPQAVAELNTFVTLQTNSSLGWTKLGTALVRMKRPDDAERALNQALRLDPKNAEAQNALGLAHIQRKRPREAMLAFNNAIQYSPAYAPALLNQAVIAQQHFGDKPRALERYRAFLATKPDAKTTAQVQQVVNLLEREISGAPTASANTETNQFAAFLRTNLATRIETSSNQPGVTTTTNLVGRNARTNLPPAIASNLTVAAGRTTNNPPRAAATNIVGNAPTNIATAASTNKPVAAAETEPEEPALTVEVVKVEKEPEFKAIADVAESRTPTNSTVAAASNIPDTRPLIIPRRDRKDVEKRGLLSRVNPAQWFKDEQKSTVNPPDATVTRQQSSPPPRPSYPPVIKVTDPKPEPPRVIPRYQYRKSVPLKKGDRALAQKLFQQGVEAHQRKRLAEAMEAYQDATSIDPSFYDAHYNFALAAYQNKNLPLALSANELALAAKPSSSDARYNFALTLRDANYPADAANELRVLVTERPDEVRAHFTLANLYAQQLDEPVLARRHYVAVLELNPNHPEAPAIRQWLGSHQ